MTSIQLSPPVPGHHDVAAPPSGMRTYLSWIGGEYVPSSSWVYVVDAAALLDDAFATLRLKRDLERGHSNVATAPPSVVGRVARADSAAVAASVEAAARAAGRWARMPLDTRVGLLGAQICRRLADRADEITEVLVQEGHPLALARWQVSGMLECFGPQSVSFYRSLMLQEFEHGPRRISV
nr:aldehyde dehydrogenase family protein [Micromonospora sp. DSM 115978]